MPAATKNKIISVVFSTNVEKWAEFLAANRYSKKETKPKTLTVDLNACYFIYPYHLVSLACLIEEYHLKGVQISFTYNNKGIVGQYLEKIKFLDYWMPNYNRNDFQNILIENTISLWKLERERLSSFASHVQQFFENTFFKGKDLLPLNIAIAEACNNILDHSESKAGGFILTQYYKKDDLLIVSICDFGVGIPKKINDFRAKNNEPKLKPCKAIEKALEKKYTTKSAPHNAGLGLDNIFSNVKETKGRLLIVSKNGCISKRIGETDVEEEMKAQFPGTHLVISLGTKALNEKEKEIAEEIDLF